MCVCVRWCVCPSLFAGDTPAVYTAPANAILVVGPCLWALLGDVHMKTDQAHTIPSSGGHAQFFKMFKTLCVKFNVLLSVQFC